MFTKTVADSIVGYYETATQQMHEQFEKNVEDYQHYVHLSHGLIHKAEALVGLVGEPENPGFPIESVPELGDIVPQLVEEEPSKIQNKGMRLIYANPKELLVDANSVYDSSIQESVILCFDGSVIASRIGYEGARPVYADVAAFDTLRHLIRSDRFGPRAQKEIFHNYLLYTKGKGVEIEHMHVGATAA